MISHRGTFHARQRASAVAQPGGPENPRARVEPALKRDIPVFSVEDVAELPTYDTEDGQAVADHYLKLRACANRQRAANLRSRRDCAGGAPLQCVKVQGDWNLCDGAGNVPRYPSVIGYGNAPRGSGVEGRVALANPGRLW